MYYELQSEVLTTDRDLIVTQFHKFYVKKASNFKQRKTQISYARPLLRLSYWNNCIL